MDFLPFDPDAEIARHRRRLPHWIQAGYTYFVSFRLADSLTATVRRAIERERRNWLEKHGLSSADDLANLPERIQRDYRNHFSEKIESLLDAGHGTCLLKKPANAAVVGNALNHFSGERYHLDAWVAMHNHVHLLICPLASHRLSVILQSIKRHSSREINRLENRTGAPLWLDENFDHLVRSTDQLERFRRYIAANPRNAGLRPGEYLLQRGADL